MNMKGHLFGLVGYFMMVIFAILVSMLAPFFPTYNLLFLIVAALAISLGGFVFFYSFTVEGNTLIAKYFAGQNVGIDVLGEPGNVLVFHQVKVNTQGFNYADADYKITNASVGLRRGFAIPYTFHKLGIAEPFMFGENVSGMDAAENTAYLNRFKDFIRTKMFAEQFRTFLLLLIGAIAVTIIVGAFLYFSMTDLSGAIGRVSNQVVEISAKLPSVSPIPGAIPNA